MKYQTPHKVAVFTKTKRCNICNKEFLPVSGRQVYCSLKCAKVKPGLYSKKWGESNKKRLQKLNAAYFQKNKQKYNQNHQWRYRNDKDYFIACKMRSSVYQCLHLFGMNGSKRKSNTLKYLGCDKTTLQKHIESQFTKNINWENRHQWHIDHIIPINYFLKNKLPVEYASHYTNLQPLLKTVNLRKNKVVDKSSLYKIIDHPATPDGLRIVSKKLLNQQ